MPPKKKQKLIKGQPFILFGRPNEHKVDKSDPGPSTQTATESDRQKLSEKEGQKVKSGARIAQLVVLGLTVHSVAGSILLWGHFPVEGIFPLELTWVQTPFPKKLFRMRV